MGRQFYVFFFNTEEELLNILLQLANHNAEEDDKGNSVDVGEPLEGLVITKLKIPFNEGPYNRFNFKYAVLAGHGGGRGQTTEYFLKSKTKFVHYNSDFYERYQPADKWEFSEGEDFIVRAKIGQQILGF